MILEPFVFAALGYRFVDAQDLSTRDRRLVGIALADGFRQFDGGDHCKTVGQDPEGDYPIIRFGVLQAGELVGGWWLGCNEQLPGSTPRDVRLRSVGHPGATQGNFASFFNARETVKIAKAILNKTLQVRGGGTVKIVEFTFTADPANSEFGPLPTAASNEAKDTAGLVVVEKVEGSRTRFTLSRAGG